jgi:ABC-type sugar transport system permease subunit
MYLLFLVWYPALQGLYMSFFEWPLLGDQSYVGIGNYEYLLTWEAFRRSIFTTVIYSLQTVGHLVLGTVMGLIVWRQKRFKTVTSLMFLIPILLPPLVTGTLFRHVLEPDLGPFFALLVDFGLLKSPIYWSNDGNLALLVITLVGVWTWSSFVFLLVYASLESIPDAHIEASRLYGAGAVQRLRRVILPQIKTALLIALVLRIIRNLGKVAQPYQITRGGPGFDTTVLGLLVYRLAWERGELGLAFAGSIVLGLITFVFIALFMWQFERSSEEVAA